MRPKKAAAKGLKPDCPQDENSKRATFTSALVEALKELEVRPVPSALDLGHRAYSKLQFDYPLLSPSELQGLDDLLRASLHHKSSRTPLPVSSKMLDNLVQGARAPTASTSSCALPRASTDGVKGAPAAPETGYASSAAAVSREASNAPLQMGSLVAESLKGDERVANTGGAGSSEAAAPTLPTSLLQSSQPGSPELQAAYRCVCSVVLVQLMSHCLESSEQDAWELLHGLCSQRDEEDEQDSGQGAETAGASTAGDEQGVVSSDVSGGSEGRCQAGTGGAASSEGPVRSGAASASGGLAANGLDLGAGSGGDLGLPPELAAGLSLGEGPPQRQVLYEEQEAAEEDGDDFVFEEIEASTSTFSASAPVPASSLHHHPFTTPSSSAPAPHFGRQPPALIPTPPPAPPYSWPALQRALLHLGGQVSYPLLEDDELWTRGSLLAGVLRVLRSLGAHRHAAELGPLLGAYVGLLADRIAAVPDELGSLDSLWDALGVSCIASMPQLGAKARQANAGSRRGPLLLAEASTCLSLVASLAGQLNGAGARARLWQQVHHHMLPLLERCLGELARAVALPAGSKPLAAQKQMAQAAAEQGPVAGGPAAGPGPEEVAAIVLVCQVLDFYVQQRPANADLAAALRGSGVLASLAVLFGAAAATPGAEPLRSAALCCAASGRELHDWLLAVPGVAQALAGPAFQEGGPHEAHGAVWQLLGSCGAAGGGGRSPTALCILDGGAAPGKAIRVHGLLTQLAKAVECRQGRGERLWDGELDSALRELFAALKAEQGGAAAGANAGGGETAVNGKAGAPQHQPEASGSVASASGEPVSGAASAGSGGCAGPMHLGDGSQDEDEDDDKLQLLDPEALLRRRARQLHPVCWRMLKQLLTSSGDARSKTD